MAGASVSATSLSRRGYWRVRSCCHCEIDVIAFTLWMWVQISLIPKWFTGAVGNDISPNLFTWCRKSPSLHDRMSKPSSGRVHDVKLHLLTNTVACFQNSGYVHIQKWCDFFRIDEHCLFFLVKFFHWLCFFALNTWDAELSSCLVFGNLPNVHCVMKT